MITSTTLFSEYLDFLSNVGDAEMYENIFEAKQYITDVFFVLTEDDGVEYTDDEVKNVVNGAFKLYKNYIKN